MCNCTSYNKADDLKPLALKNSRTASFGLGYSSADDLKPLQLKNSRTALFGTGFTYADDLKPLQLKNSLTDLSLGYVPQRRSSYRNASENPALCNMYPAGSAEFIECWSKVGKTSEDTKQTGGFWEFLNKGLDFLKDRKGGQQTPPPAPAPTQDKDYTGWIIGGVIGLAAIAGGIYWYKQSKNKAA